LCEEISLHASFSLPTPALLGTLVRDFWEEKRGNKGRSTADAPDGIQTHIICVRK